MPNGNNKKTHNIFCIDVEKVKSGLLGVDECTMVEAVDALVSHAAHYEEQVLKTNIDTMGFTLRLIFFGEEKYNSKLRSFCEPFVREDQKAVTFHPKTASTVLFAWSDSHLFAITTGQGFRVVESYCVSKFGLLIISTFQDMFRVTALDSNGMSSIVHSSKTIYTNEIDFVDVDALDTIFKEVVGRLNDQATVRSMLRLDRRSKKKSMKVTAKNFVQYSSSLDFKGLLHILTLMDRYDYTQLQDNFNLISPVSPKQEPATISENNQKIIETIYDNIISDRPIGFDLFHHTTNEFISADSYSLFIDNNELNRTDDIEPTDFIVTAYNTYLHDDQPSLETFKVFIEQAKIYAYNEDIMVTHDDLLKHISGEILVGGKSYYVFYGEYYFLSESYNERLNKSLEGKLRADQFTQEIHTGWGPDDQEDDFNRRASENEGYIHLHKVKPEFVEFADLLKYEDDVITVVHVKDGFDNDMRALDRQVELSIKRVLDLKFNNNQEYMKKLYEKATAHNVGINIRTVFPTEDDFIECMQQKDVRYVIAINPPNKDLLQNISNIAKHCLNALILRCFNQGIELKINIL